MSSWLLWGWQRRKARKAGLPEPPQDLPCVDPGSLADVVGFGPWDGTGVAPSLCGTGDYLPMGLTLAENFTGIQEMVERPQLRAPDDFYITGGTMFRRCCQTPVGFPHGRGCRRSR